MLLIGNLAIQLTTPLLLRKPCKLFASFAQVCQRQLGSLVIKVNSFLNGMRYINPRFTYLLTYHCIMRYKATNSNCISRPLTEVTNLMCFEFQFTF